MQGSILFLVTKRLDQPTSLDLPVDLPERGRLRVIDADKDRAGATGCGERMLLHFTGVARPIDVTDVGSTRHQGVHLLFCQCVLDPRVFCIHREGAHRFTINLDSHSGIDNRRRLAPDQCIDGHLGGPGISPASAARILIDEPVDSTLDRPVIGGESGRVQREDCVSGRLGLPAAIIPSIITVRGPGTVVLLATDQPLRQSRFGSVNVVAADIIGRHREGFKPPESECSRHRLIFACRPFLILLFLDEVTRGVSHVVFHVATVLLIQLNRLVDHVVDEHDERCVRLRNPRMADGSAPRPGAAIWIVGVIVEPPDQALEVYLAGFKRAAVRDLAFKEPV